MYLILVKENSDHKLFGIAEDISEVKSKIKDNDLQDKIKNGKAYLVEGKISLIRPETTPELLEIKEIKKKKDMSY
ncbi:hypothetical protein LCGC14_2501120 [marine sediment metagenome]|uniref:Uncharacterized protein n=1 Tax=marine sediment metagenome TaxID=412755 RepID=A0A0F9B1T3_9ZZZZ